MRPQVASLITACGGFREAVHAFMTFSRAFWTLCLDESERQKSPKRDLYRRGIDAERLRSLYGSALGGPLSAETFQIVKQRVTELDICRIEEDGSYAIRRSVANPLDFIRATLQEARPDYELKYFVMQNIRRHYRFQQSAAAAHQFHALAIAVNALLVKRIARNGTMGQTLTLEVHRDILPTLKQATEQSAVNTPHTIELFLETCRAVNYLRLSWRPNHVEVPALSIDAEFLLSRMFGLPTQIKGLDDLFGGGGIMFVDAAEPSDRIGIGGRAVVTVGPFGSAKSLLTLQIAIEVARKGGVAWVMPLEQTAEECLYTMESMGCLRDDAPLCVATTVPEAIELLDHPVAGKGALILLRTVKEKFEDFLMTFEENVSLMAKYPLRLIVVDPISAVSQQGMGDDAEKRGRMLHLFDSIKRRGTNVWLVTEESSVTDGTPYEEKIADTVIRLFSESRYGYSQRYIEIKKSRMQRELRGSHAFTIGPGRGITIYPSPAAVRSRLRKRSERMAVAPIEFGLPSLDKILGKGSLYAGDIIVLQGPSGCSKTQVGLPFLLNADWGSGRPMLLSARDSESTIRHTIGQFEAMMQAKAGEIRSSSDIRVVAIEGGYVKPGYILQRLEDEFINSRLNDRPIGRVMIDNIAHWEFSCPYIREDETFGDTLIDMLRRHGVTAVLTCGEPRHDSESVLQRSILDNADCVIRFERIELRGASQIMLKVLKTRDMTHRKENFELLATPELLDVKTTSSLVRVGNDGSLSSVKIRLFLHSESEAQTAYNNTILMATRSTLSKEVVLESENPIQISRVLSLGESSSIDELQILQLDEFQLPVAYKTMARDLYTFPKNAWGPKDWGEILPPLRSLSRTAKGYLVVPFYENVGLLAYRNGLPLACTESWKELSIECMRWERDNEESGDVFFSFPMVTSENFNVLFLEILFWLTGPPPRMEEGIPSCVLREWLTSEESVEATIILHRLCRRAYALEHESGSLDLLRPATFKVTPRAQVWRHWYTTLNQMFSDMSTAERAEISVSTLPGNASVAGEWYLGVPSYSAAPDVGLRLIQLYTSKEAEIDRLKYGVGLPVRTSFYTQQASESTSVSPYFSMNTSRLLHAIEGALRRSSFGCYRRYSSILSTHLQSVLMLSWRDKQELDQAIQDRIIGLKQRLAFVESSACNWCSTRRQSKRL
jgi:KaiC/GvpD/RAD55 family RecA-like ATPase